MGFVHRFVKANERLVFVDRPPASYIKQADFHKPFILYVKILCYGLCRQRQQVQAVILSIIETYQRNQQAINTQRCITPIPYLLKLNPHTNKSHAIDAIFRVVSQSFLFVN